MKYLSGILVGVCITLVLVVVYLSQRNGSSLSVNKISPTPTANEVAIYTPTPTLIAGSPTPLAATTGIISGKLCYPSQFLPQGSIEAKNTTTNVVTSQNYVGSQNGGTSAFSMSVQPGTYILRYKAVPDQSNPTNVLYGYYTDVCPTGVEPTCSASNARKNKEIVVTNGSATNGVALCDFYYDQNNPPTF